MNAKIIRGESKPNSHRKHSNPNELQQEHAAIALEHSLRLARLVDMLEMLHDMLVDDMPEHPEAERIRALSFAAIDVARIADKGIGKLAEMPINAGGGK
ncbi:MAG: hypothetical protein Q8J80_09840 [Gallionella sp.]|nr:hypothetical protein [Gallionella sp.]